MALKKPSELFKDEPKKKVEVPEQLEGILPENFDAYKSNVKNIEVLNDFVSSFGTLKENIQKVDNLEEVIQSLKEELQDSITKEDLDTAMMSNLLVLEKNIQKIEFNLKGINRKDLNKIEEEIEDIENKVLYVFEEEFPKYKKALKSNEIFIKDKFYEYSSEIDEKVNQFEEFIANSFEVIKENLQSINNNQLIDIREDVVKSSQEVENQNQLIEKTKKQIFGLEKNVQEFYQKIEEAFQSYQQSQEKKILTLEESISSFGEEEIKKYKSLLQETRIQNDEKIHSFEKNLTEKYLKISQSVSSLLSSVENKSITIEELKENLENIQGDYSRKEDQQKDIIDLKEQLTKKINLLENDISFKENKIKKANQELTEEIKKISNQFDDLNVEELKKKYSQLTNKISYIEEVFEKFNEKTILNEGLLDEPPTIKNSDPLTPLDKNYVTLEQLQEHYRLFINRIQQQLSTIGGGGETRLKYLDDIVGIATNASAYDGKFLKYNHSTESFVFETVSGGGGGGGESYWASTPTGIHTLSNMGVGTTAKSDFKLFVEGNAKITGILTVGNQSVTIDGTNNTVNVGSGVTINGNTGIISATAIYVGGSQVSTFSGNYNDLTNKPDLSTISVAYATTAGIATYATTAGIATALQNSRTFEITGDIIASPISFDGTGNVSLAATIQPNSVALGGDTTGNYVASITNGSYITGGDGGSESAALTLAVDATSSNTVSKVVARDASGNFSAGTITANLTGTATTATNLSDGANITTGTISDDRLPDLITSNINITSGVSTFATVKATTFEGSLTGNSSTATALQNARTFEITGDIIASPISFNGTGNVSLAATIQPNSVALGGDTTGDYVQSITGTSNQITVTSGTGESSTPTLSIPSQFTAPQDVTVTRDLQVNRNLNVNGNITIGGTSATLFSQELKVFDPDIVLGFRTDALGNDISTDNTANHGGIAIASTEGTPLISLYDVGVGETNPATYKKIMWFKSGTFSGLGTDAWISNYAIGIGSTQFPSGTRLAVGSVQFTERDLSVVRNINASGVVTATTFAGALTGTATSTTNIPNLSGDVSSNNTVTTLATVNSNVGTYGDAGAIPSITVNAKGLVIGVTTVAPNNGQLSLAVSGTGLSGSATFTANQSGSSTFTVTSNATDANTPSTIVARDASGNFSAGTITANLTGTATTATNLADAANITTGTINSSRLSGTYAINVSYASTAGVATVSQGLTGTPNITVGVVTATSFVKSGGTSSQFLKADGSVDSSTYLTTTGSGTNLTGIVTSITAGSGISIDQSTGNVTITNSGGSVGAVGISKTTFTYISTEGQTTFNATYNVGYVDVYLNGSKLSQSQYTATTGTSIVLNEGASLNDVIEIIGFGGIIGVGIATAGGIVGTGVTLLDFRGAGISTVTVSSGIGTINIEGGGGSTTPDISPVMMGMIF